LPQDMPFGGWKTLISAAEHRTGTLWVPVDMIADTSHVNGDTWRLISVILVSIGGYVHSKQSART
jgi:hypothetical protein